MAELAQRKAEKVAAAHARREAEKAEAAAAEAAKGSVLHQIGQYFAERFGTAVKQCSGEAKLEAEEMARMEKAAAAFINAAAKAALNTWIEEYKSKLKLRAAAKSIMMKLRCVRAQLVGRDGGGEETNRGRNGEDVSRGARQDRSDQHVVGDGRRTKALGR